MRRLSFLPLLLALAVFSPLPAHAYPALGALVSTGTSVNNVTTGTPFTVQPGAMLLVQCNGAAYVNVFTTAAGAVATATNAVQVSSGQLFPLPGSSGATYVAMLPVSGSVTCVVFASAP